MMVVRSAKSIYTVYASQIVPLHVLVLVTAGVVPQTSIENAARRATDIVAACNWGQRGEGKSDPTLGQRKQSASAPSSLPRWHEPSAGGVVITLD